MVQNAINHNPDVKATRAQLAAAQELLNQSRAALLPDVDLKIAPSHGHSTWRNSGKEDSDTAVVSLNLAQALY